MKNTENWLIIALIVLQGMLGQIIQDPASLGIPAKAAAWLGVLTMGLALVLNQMNALGASRREASPKDPAAAKPTAKE